MRLDYFEYLATLSRHASMSAASRELHVTPQALSVAIGRLERELGVKLVRTDNQGTRLNENGRYLVAKTQMFFDAIAEVRAQSQAAEGPCAVRVLADTAIKEDFAAELVRRLDEAAQPLALALDYCDLAEVKTRFLAGNYDLAICYRDQVGGVPVHVTEPGLIFEAFWRSPIYVVMSAQHPLAAKGSATLAEIAESGVPLVVDAYGMGFVDVLRMFAPQMTIVREDNLIAVQKQVKNNLGVALDYISFDGLVVRGKPEGCVAFPLSDDIAGDLGYLLREDALPSRGTRVFLDYLLNVIAQPSGVQR